MMAYPTTTARWVRHHLLRLGLALAIGLPGAATAQETRQTLGYSQVFTNDTLAQYRDRWRTGGYAFSLFRGPEWDGNLPETFGALLEFRLRGEAIAPRDLAMPEPFDRLYAGAWWIGVHSHSRWAGMELSAGLDLVISGPQTGIRDIHAAIHDALDLPAINVTGFEIADGIHAHATLELARPIGFDGGQLRPFVELQAGAETLARAGFDLILGDLAHGALLTREPTTGQRIPALLPDGRGDWSVLFGADVAYVDSSIFLPSDRGPTLEETRRRVRGGLVYRHEDLSVFYGFTYLSPEFIGQPEGQLVGNIALTVRF